MKSIDQSWLRPAPALTVGAPTGNFLRFHPRVQPLALQVGLREVHTAELAAPKIKAGFGKPIPAAELLLPPALPSVSCRKPMIYSEEMRLHVQSPSLSLVGLESKSTCYLNRGDVGVYRNIQFC